MKANRIVPCLSAAVLLCGALPASAANEETYLTYEIHEDHAVVTACDTNAETIVIPSQVDGVPVTEIGANAFQQCRELTRVTIPDSVEKIGDSAFYCCESLTEIIIPESVKYLGSLAFYVCENLETIQVPENLEWLGANVFLHTAWENNQPDGVLYLGNILYQYNGIVPDGTVIAIEEGTTGIAPRAFEGAKGLAEITIPNTVTYIGDLAFRNTSALQEIVLPESVVSIGENAFSYSVGLENITILNPECEIYDSQETIFSFMLDENYYYKGIISGYPDSTAQVYAETYGYQFRSVEDITTGDLIGDVNCDGEVTILDVITLNQNVLSGTILTEQGQLNADVDGDGAPTVTDSMTILQYVIKLIDSLTE